jgi:beta-lactamase superfamily II metal-dependent hydrolase
MSEFGLDALDAHKGDALVLRWGKKAGDHVALIDGGPDTIYSTTIVPHLEARAGKNPLGQPNPIVLDLVVVSHVDDDHIQGILDLANAMDRADKQSKPRPMTVNEVWHNSFEDMAFLADFADEPELVQAIKDAAAKPQALVPAGAVPKDDPTVGDITAGAQGVGQGRSLDRILQTVGPPRNDRFKDRGGFVRDGKPIKLDGLTIDVLLPNTALLALLKGEWRTELKKILKKEANKKKAGISALAAAFDDPSVPNQSSIVLHVAFGGKTMLLTGDARGDHILDALRPTAGAKPKKMRVDLFKVGHHGSDHSNGTELFETVIADRYVISGNGEHGNPHPTALKALFDTQKGRPITVYLTNHPQVGAKLPDHKRKAKAAQKVLDAAAQDPNVTIVYREDSGKDATAVTVDLL